MNKMRQGLRSENPNDVEAIKNLKSLVRKASEDRRQEKLLQLKGQRRQRQASLTAVFRVADGVVGLKEQLEMIKTNIEQMKQ